MTLEGGMTALHVPESRAAQLTCLGRQMGAHPLGQQMRPGRTLQGNRLKRLCISTVAGPKHNRGLVVNRRRCRQDPIWCRLSVPDVPAGQILPSELGGPGRRKWRAIDSDFLA